MNFEKLMADRLNKAIEDRQVHIADAQLALLENQDFINTQVKLAMLNNEVSKLNTIITQLNMIKPFIAKDGRKFNINVFPQSAFGPGLSQLIGIIQGAKSAFTDEMAIQYEAITGISHLELVMASDALGTTDYYKPGTTVVTPGQEGDLSLFIQLLRGISAKLGLSESVPTKDDDIDRLITKWQVTSSARAIKQLDEYNKSEDLDTESFTLED